MLLYLMAEIEDWGDKARFIWLYNNFRHKMYRVALHILGEEDGAQDAVQQSFLKIIQNFSRVSKLSQTEVGPYVITIAENTAKDMLRRQKRWAVNALEDELWIPPAAETVESETAYTRLVELILSMPDSYRDILYLSCVEEQSPKEIAHRLGLKQGQVDGRLHRGKKLLREIVEKEGYQA